MINFSFTKQYYGNIMNCATFILIKFLLQTIMFSVASLPILRIGPAPALLTFFALKHQISLDETDPKNCVVLANFRRVGFDRNRALETNPSAFQAVRLCSNTLMLTFSVSA